MANEKRYTVVKNQILGGYLKTLREVFDIVPKTVVAKDMKIHNMRFADLIDNVQLFKLDEIYRLAALIGIDEKPLLDIVHAQYMQDKKGKRKK
jgi:hypothetical protein